MCMYVIMWEGMRSSCRLYAMIFVVTIVAMVSPVMKSISRMLLFLSIPLAAIYNPGGTRPNVQLHSKR